MRTLAARNLDSGQFLADRVSVAAGRLARAVGLLTRSSFEPGEALWIAPCRGVHTCGMRFAIDILALDASGAVVDLVLAMRPWRIRLPRRGAVGVLELPCGSLSRSQTRVGDRIALEPEPTANSRQPTARREPF